MEAPITLRVNGKVCKIDGDALLLDELRGTLGLKGSRFGCGTEQCGACLVLVDGYPAYACTLPASAASNKAVTTIEGLGTPAAPHPLQEAFIAEQAAQCGYCTNGMVMSSVALLAGNPKPTREQTQAALAGNLCRCGSHDRVLKAVSRASGQGKAP